MAISCGAQGRRRRRSPAAPRLCPGRAILGSRHPLLAAPDRPPPPRSPLATAALASTRRTRSTARTAIASSTIPPQPLQPLAAGRSNHEPRRDCSKQRGSRYDRPESTTSRRRSLGAALRQQCNHKKEEDDNCARVDEYLAHRDVGAEDEIQRGEQQGVLSSATTAWTGRLARTTQSPLTRATAQPTASGTKSSFNLPLLTDSPVTPWQAPPHLRATRGGPKGMKLGFEKALEAPRFVKGRERG